MRAAVERIVQRHHIARLQRFAPIVQHGAHALAHGAEMHRHVRRVCHQIALRIEDGTGEVQPLLDVYAHRGVLQHRTGLLGHVHEQVVEQFEQHRIGPAAVRRDARRETFGAAQRHVIERRDLGCPSRFHHGGGIGLADQRGAGDAVARQQVGAIEHRRGMLVVAGEDGDGVDGLRSAVGTAGQCRLLHRLAGRDRLDRDRLDHQRPIRGGEAEPRAMCGGEVGDDLRQVAQLHDQCRLRAGIAQMQVAVCGDRARDRPPALPAPSSLRQPADQQARAIPAWHAARAEFRPPVRA